MEQEWTPRITAAEAERYARQEERTAAQLELEGNAAEAAICIIHAMQYRNLASHIRGEMRIAAKR